MELFRKILASCGADFDQPLVRYVQDRENGKFSTPYVPVVRLMPLYKLCRQTLLWFGAGFKEQASGLVPFLLRAEPFASLWCPESEFNEEDRNLFYFLSNIEKGEEIPLPMDAQFLKNERIEAVFTRSGVKGSPIGIVHTDQVQIRAIGPQAFPLNTPEGFGVQGEGRDGWSCTAAQPEVWVHTIASIDEKSLQLKFRFVGLRSETPMAVAFYVKAPGCRVHQQMLKPKSLLCFDGQGQVAQFYHLSIESQVPRRMQVIPLAGAGCFWNCDFLLAFEAGAAESEMNFSIEIAK